MKVEPEGTRSPPIQWSVETSTPSTSTRPLSADLPEIRSYPNGMDGPPDLSNRPQPIVTLPRMPKS